MKKEIEGLIAESRALSTANPVSTNAVIEFRDSVAALYKKAPRWAKHDPSKQELELSRFLSLAVGEAHDAMGAARDVDIERMRVHLKDCRNLLLSAMKHHKEGSQ